MREGETESTSRTADDFVVIRICPTTPEGVPTYVEAALKNANDTLLQLNPKPTGRVLAQHFQRHRATPFVIQGKGKLYITSASETRDGVLRWVVRNSQETGEINYRERRGDEGTISAQPGQGHEQEKTGSPTDGRNDPSSPRIPPSSSTKQGFRELDE